MKIDGIKLLQMIKDNQIKEETLIEVSGDEEINKKVQEFEKQLIYKRNQYIAEIMKVIQILHEQEPKLQCMNYKIIFENIQRVEKSD